MTTAATTATVADGGGGGGGGMVGFTTPVYKAHHLINKINEIYTTPARITTSVKYDRNLWFKHEGLRDNASLWWTCISEGFYKSSDVRYKTIVFRQKCYSNNKDCAIDLSKDLSTTNLKHHVEAHHKDEYRAVTETVERNRQRNVELCALQPKMSDVFHVYKAKKELEAETRKKLQQEKYINYVVETKAPLNTVEKQSFRELMESLDKKCPNFTVRSLKESIMKSLRSI